MQGLIQIIARVINRLNGRQFHYLVESSKLVLLIGMGLAFYQVILLIQGHEPDWRLLGPATLLELSAMLIYSAIVAAKVEDNS